MESFDIVHVFDKMRKVGFGFVKGAILVDVDLLAFERSEKTFGFVILIGIAYGCHTDLSLDALQALDIGATGILYPMIGMVNESWGNCAQSQRLIEGIQGQLRINA